MGQYQRGKVEFALNIGTVGIMPPFPKVLQCPRACQFIPHFPQETCFILFASEGPGGGITATQVSQ